MDEVDGRAPIVTKATSTMRAPSSWRGRSQAYACQPGWSVCAPSGEPSATSAIVALCVVLVTVVAWQLGEFAVIAPALLSGMLLATLTPTVLVMRRRYRHVVAGALVLAMLLGLFAAAIHRYGYPATVAFVLGPTPSAVADAVTPR